MPNSAVRWVTAYDRELQIFNSQGANPADMPWMFRYIPFANLYDLSLAFAFGAGVTTLLVLRRPQFKIVAALTLPLAAIILALADEIEARCPRDRRITVDCEIDRHVVLTVRALPSWLAKDLDTRFEHAFGRALIVRHG
mgnify:CR=1 FL=1